MSRFSKASLFLVAAAALLLAPRMVQAYPQWQFSSGASRCGQCHYSPAGGGPITTYARDAVGEELSTLQGNGAAFHGALTLPTWLALGLDLRGAALRQETGGPSPTTAVFPMQTDLSVRAALGDAFSISVTAGYRGRARGDDAPVAADNYHPQPAADIISREHYVMWRPEARGPYLRAGRFYAPYGLRLAEHTMYVRSDLGFGVLQESYGLSGGVVQDNWEVHVTGFGPDLLRQTGNRESGGAALFEGRLADSLALGADVRAGFLDGSHRYQGGLFGKGYLAPARTMLMTELDLVDWNVPGAGSTRQFVGLAGLTVFAVRGLWLAAFVERSQSDIAVKDTATDAVDGQINWFPYPHVELVLLGRAQKPSGQQAAHTVLVQLHYFL